MFPFVSLFSYRQYDESSMDFKKEPCFKLILVLVCHRQLVWPVAEL